MTAWTDADTVLKRYARYQTNEEVRICGGRALHAHAWPPACRIRLPLPPELRADALLPVYGAPPPRPVILAPSAELQSARGGAPVGPPPPRDEPTDPLADDGGENQRAKQDDGGLAESGVEVRRLTAEGLRRARKFLAHMRENPGASREPPRSLLFGKACSRPFDLGVRVERRPFRTRREAAEYFAPKFESIRHLVADHAGLWSWLGMFYFADTVRVEDDRARLSPVDETFVVNHEVRRSYLLRYRHYLWGSWRLFVTHGESVSFLLDQELTSFTHFAERAFGSIRIFNSVGAIQLMLRLYTNNGRQKRGFGRRPGGLRHLLRVLDQLERTYDVYGMTPEALVRILPAEFQRWDGQTPASPAAARQESAAAAAGNAPPSAAAERRAPTPAARETSPAYAAPAADPQPDAPVSPRRPDASPTDGAASEETPAADEAASQPADDAVGQPVDEAVGQPVDDALGHLVEAHTRILALSPGSWVDLRDYLQEDAAAWRAYTTASGAPEPRLFRDFALRRLEDAIQSTGGG